MSRTSPGRRVEQHLLQAVHRQPVRDRVARVLVREHELNRVEAIVRRRFEAVEEGVLGVQHRQVGGEARHGYQRTPKAP